MDCLLQARPESGQGWRTWRRFTCHEGDAQWVKSVRNPRVGYWAVCSSALCLSFICTTHSLAPYCSRTPLRSFALSLAHSLTGSRAHRKYVHVYKFDLSILYGFTQSSMLWKSSYVLTISRRIGGKMSVNLSRWVFQQRRCFKNYTEKGSTERRCLYHENILCRMPVSLLFNVSVRPSVSLLVR